MSSINKVILIGRVGKDPETTFNPNGTSQVTKFSLATSEQYSTKENEKQESTEWHNIVMWNKLSDIYKEIIKKGQLLFVEGKIKTNKWTDKENVTHYKTEIWASTVRILQKPEGSNNSSNSTNNSKVNTVNKEEFSQIPLDDDDIPF